MRNRIIALGFVVALIYGSLWLGNAVVIAPGFYLAIVVGIIPVAVCAWIIVRSRTPDQRFLARVFAAALAVRYALAYVIYSRNLQQFLGADADTYDAFGNALLQSWRGLVDPNVYWLVKYTTARTSGFGMYYYVAGLYYVIGQNPLAIQLINCAIGAGVCIAGYKIAMMVYPNQRVARAVAVMSAFSPSLVLWTSQGLKDGPIMLFLCLCVLYTLKVREKVEIKSFILLLLSLLCLYTLRHYAAYIMFTAMSGSLVFTARKKLSAVRMLQGAVLVIIIGLTFSYFGAGDVAKTTIDLQKIQNARVWGAKVSNSGFGGDVDITDPKAAIEYLPVGILYVLLAPFPWMINNLRQLITLPELIAWWFLMPMMVKGYWFAVRKRLRESFAICTFVLGLTLAFAMFQSNAGTAYRHRSQLYVFFFVFICIGLELRRSARIEKRNRMSQPFPMGAFSRPAVAQQINRSPMKIQTR
ncbi:MAG: glycosyltransferase family 39 protein [Acidobacteriota bacterium]